MTGEAQALWIGGTGSDIRSKHHVKKIYYIMFFLKKSVGD